MGARMSMETIRAMSMVNNEGITPYQAAKAVGIVSSTLYSALKKQRILMKKLMRKNNRRNA